MNVALGPERTVERALHNVRDYYGFSGRADHVVDGLVTTPEGVREAVGAFFDIGADEVMLYCWSSDVDQVDRIADAVF